MAVVEISKMSSFVYAVSGATTLNHESNGVYEIILGL